jgi:hypothetical protein
MNARAAVGLAALLALSLAASGCARRGLVLTEQADSAVSSEVYGDITAVANRETTRWRPSTVPAGAFKAALGVGTVGDDPAVQGDAVMVGSSIFVRDPRPDADPAFATSDAAARVSFMVGTPPRVNPTARYRVQGGREGITLEEIYRDLAGRHGTRLFVVGVGTLAYAETTHLTTPEHATTAAGPALAPPAKSFETPALFTAVVLGDVGEYRGSNRRVFWVDPAEEGTVDEITQTHYLQLSSAADIDPNNPQAAIPLVNGVGRLLPGSRVKQGTLAVYQITDFDRR